MVNIKIDDIVYDIPESWDDVSINKWRSLKSIQQYIKEGMDDEQKFNIQLEIISTLTDIPFDTLLNVPGQYYKKILEYIDFYNNVKLKEDVTLSFTIDDKEYKLIDLKKLTLGDRANIDIIRDSDTLENRIGRLMSILYRYEGEPDLDIDGRDDKEALFNEEVSINAVYGTLLFFLILTKEYEKLTKYSLIEKKVKMLTMKMKWWKRMKMKMKSVIRNITIAWRIGYQKGASWILKKYLK